VIEVSVTGAQGIEQMLGQYVDPLLSKRAQRATKAGATVLAPPLRDAVRPLSKRMAASVYVHVARREKPAYVVGHHRRIAFFWHMVIGGTKAHSLTSRKTGRRGPTVRGVEPHPVIIGVAETYGEAAYRAVLADLSKDS
jgi:hypothetical protein